MNNMQWYRYAPDNLLYRQAVVVWVAVIMALVGGAALLMQATVPAFTWPLVVMSFPLIILAAAPLIALAFATADISTNEEGITLHVMGIYTRQITWGALRHTTIWEVEPKSIVDVLALHHWDEVHALYVPGLKGFNVTGSLLGLGQMSVIVITPDHDRSEHLLRRLRHMQHPMGRENKKPDWKPLQ